MKVLLVASNSAGRARQVFTIVVQRHAGLMGGKPPMATVGRHYSFSVTAYGYPRPSITETGKLPAGLVFAKSGKGRAVLAGIPANGTDGAHRIGFTVSNSLGKVTEHYTLVIQKGKA